MSVRWNARALSQALTFAVIAAIMWWLARNTQLNLEQRGLSLGFEFLRHPANFEIGDTSGLQFSPEHSFGRAILIGLVNTARVAVVGCALSIVLGFVLGGVFDAYPRLKIILGHLGETLPFLVWRVDHALARPGAKTLSFREAFCGHFYITTSGNFSNPALLCCVMEMGIDRILFAVDWPFVANKPAVQWMETVPLRDEDKAKILSGNAKRLFRM